MPRTLTVGATNNRCGVTLLELLIVITLMSLLAGLAYPSASAGLDTIRLRAASDQAVSFLNAALDRAQRRQQVVELRLSPAENALAARDGRRREVVVDPVTGAPHTEMPAK